MPLSKALQILVGQGHVKPLEPRPLPNPLPATHDATQYCAYHKQTGHTTDNCFRLRHEVQDLFDNGVILPPSLAKSTGTGSVALCAHLSGCFRTSSHDFSVVRVFFSSHDFSVFGFYLRLRCARTSAVVFGPLRTFSAWLECSLPHTVSACLKFIPGCVVDVLGGLFLDLISRFNRGCVVLALERLFSDLFSQFQRGCVVRPLEQLFSDLFSRFQRGHRVCHLLFLSGLPEATCHKAYRLRVLPLQRAPISPGYAELVLIDFVGLEIQFKGNLCSFTRGKVKRSVRHRPPVQQLPTQWSWNNQVKISEPTADTGILVAQLDRDNMSGLEEIVRQLQDSMKAMQQDAVRQAEFTKQQAVAPPPPRVPILGEATHVQDDTDIPGGPAPPPVLPQLSKTPTNLPDSPFEFETDPTALKVSKLEKLFKKSQGARSIPDIEDGYTDSVVTLPGRFKMPHIDRFDGSEDPMVHLQLFSGIMRPMGLTTAQKLSLFGRTLSGIAAIWYAKLENSVKQNWEGLAEAFIAQYSYNTQIEVTTRDLEVTRQEPNEGFSEFVTRAKASTMTTRPSDKDQIRMIGRNLHGKLLQKMVVLPLFTFPALHEMGVQIKDAIRQGIFAEDNEPSKRNVAHSSNATTDALKKLQEEGYLELLEPQPLPNPLPSRYDPAKYCAYHQQHDHDTNRCIRLRHKIQDLIDEETLAPLEGPQVSTDSSPPHLNLIHTLPSTFDPSIYITPAHLPKPEVFIPKSMDLCMMDAPGPQSSQTREPTTSELKRMIEDLLRIVTDLASGTSTPSSTTSHTREFMSKGSSVLEVAVFEECQSLGKVEASGKNKIGADMDPHEHHLLAVEALKAEGMNKEQVLAVVAKTVDNIFATQVEGSLNQGESREKGRCIRNVPFSYNPTLRRDQQTRPAPTMPFVGASSKNPQILKYHLRGRRVFHALYMPLPKALQILGGQGHVKPLEPWPLPNPLPATHDATQYCAYHQQTGHTTDNCFHLRHEVQDLFDNGVILPPSLAKSTGTGSVNLGG
ncbi:hypothetical protein HYC85_029549 [Camellia sinensis]|uniref:Retrotransposon gag domain-containing protein n=1 Tax=Camellia sinensis TaxID=4442 RepID=A0A7J7G0R5_CAMSI|nr:hypothetical protein HYC85_029549 [Camellia sinensis]